MKVNIQLEKNATKSLYTLSMSRCLLQNRVIQRVENVIGMMHLRLIQVNKQIEQPGQQQLIVGVALAASAQALLVRVVVAEQPLDQLVHGDH